MGAAILLLFLPAIVACSNGKGNGPDPGDTAKVKADGAPLDISGEGSKLCSPGETRCGEDGLVEKCSDDGMEYLAEPECPQDWNPCTDDGCVEGVCAHSPAARCDDGDDCTTDICLPFSGECVSELALGRPDCCVSDSDCDDGLDFTTELCDVANGACLSSAEEPKAVFLHKFGEKGSGKGQMKSPKGLAVLKDGRILVADSGNNRVLFLAQTGEQLLEVTEAAGKPLAAPGGVYEAPDGRVLVCDTGNDRLVVLNGEGEVEKVWPPADAGVKMFHSPIDIVADAKGDFYLTDGPGEEFDTGNRIIRMNSKLQVLSEAGKTGVADGNFDRPSGIAVSSDGNLFVSDQGNDRVQVLSPDLVFMAGFGGQVLDEEGEEVTPAVLDGPSDLALTPDDTIIVADYGHQQVMVFKGCQPDCNEKVCGDDGCGLSCGGCPSFGECNSQNLCDGWVGEAGDGCENKGGTGEAGCNECPCEACVCTGEGALDPSLFYQGQDSDPYCCGDGGGEWDDVCVFECMVVCGFECPMPDDWEWPVHDPTFAPAAAWSDAGGEAKLTSPLKLALDANDIVYVLDTVKAEIYLFRLHY